MNKLKLKTNTFLLIDSVPDIYKEHSLWLQCTKFANQEIWDRSLDCLIQLAVESEHYFSGEFWKLSFELAESLKMQKQKDLCQKQINKIREDKISLPLGWTSNKVSPGNFQLYIAHKQRERWDNERRQKDNISKLLNEEGFHFKPTGKTGYVYYVSQKRITEVEWHEGEIVGSTLSKYWIFPEKKLLTKEEYLKVYNDLKEWAALKNTSFRY